MIKEGSNRKSVIGGNQKMIMNELENKKRVIRKRGLSCYKKTENGKREFYQLHYRL